MIGTTLPTPLYPLYQQRFGLDSPAITIIFAIYAIAVVGGLLVFGHQSDRVGRRKTLLLGLLLSAISALLFFFATNLILIYAGRVLSGISAGIFTGCGTAAMVDYACDDQRRAVTLWAVVANVGGLGLGTLLSGVLAQWAPWPLQLCYAVDFVLVLAAVAAVWFSPETVENAHGHFTFAVQRLRVPHEIARIFWEASIAAICAFAVSGVFSAVAPSFLGKELHVHSPAISGVLVFALMWASAFGQAAVQRLPREHAFVWGCACLFAGMVLLAGAIVFHSLALLFGSAVVSGFGQGITIGFGLANINERITQRRGEVTSAYFTLLYCGLAFPVVGVGFLSVAMGLSNAGLLFAGVVALLVAAVGIYSLRPQPSRA